MFEELHFILLAMKERRGDWQKVCAAITVSVSHSWSSITTASKATIYTILQAFWTLESRPSGSKRYQTERRLSTESGHF
jgi:hypothetical protein